jgi:HD-like signal output (HDOD) protein
MIDLNRLIEQANRMPPFPATVIRLSHLVSSPDSNLDDVIELIAFDQTLTFKLLCAANSAAHAGLARVGTARDAVMRLGTAQVMALAVAVGARPQFQTKLEAYGLAEGELWRHSVSAAVAAETAPRFCRTNVPPEVFTAALLHDAGKLVMGRFISPEILKLILKSREEDGLTQLEAESLHLGMDHAELGSVMAKHWQLPMRVIQGIKYHHNPDKGMDVVCDFTYLSNHAAHRLEAGLDGKEYVFDIPAEVMERLGTNKTELEDLGPAAAGRFAQISRRYNSV